MYQMISAIAGALLISISVPTKTTSQQDTTPAYPPVPCSNVCVIEFNPGGIVDFFEAQGRQLAADKTTVIVDGPCMSACTILVDEDRANVCVTHRALLGYHQSEMIDSQGDRIFHNIPYKTPGLNEYIKSHGGLPNPESGHLLMLNFSEATQFYKACNF